MANYEIRNATHDDIAAFWEGPFRAVRAKAIFYKGCLAALAGVCIRDEALIGFCDIKEDLCAPDITYIRAAKEMMGIMTKYKAPLLAFPYAKAPNARKFLTMLGWNEIRTGVFKWQP